MSLPPLGTLPLVVERDQLRTLYDREAEREEELRDERRRVRDLEAELKRARVNATRALTAIQHGNDRAAVALIRDVLTDGRRTPRGVR